MKGDNPDPSSTQPAFLAGGGELGALVRNFNWSDTALGSVEHWPVVLKITVGIILRSPVAMALLWGEDGTLVYNDAFAEFSRDRHPTMLGMEVRQAWPEVASFNDNVLNVGLAGNTLSYKDRELTLNLNGTPKAVWLNLDYAPVLDENGRPVGVLAVIVETTERVQADRRGRAEMERLQQMFAQAPGFMAMLRGPDHVFELVNPAYEQLIGHRNVEGKSVRAALPEIVNQGFIDILDRVFESGQAYDGRAIKIGLQQTRDAPTEERFLDFVYQPIRGDDGNVSGIFVEGYDVTDHVHGEAHLRLLMNELNHRLKNTLATVRAIVRQTLRGAGPMQEAREALSARVSALSRAQDVLTKRNWQGSDIREVVTAAIAPYSDGADKRFRIEGPALALNPRAALSLSLALHELATNAAKYGALSTNTGRIEIMWSLIGHPEPHLCLEWKEHGGPAVITPSTTGFGTKLIERGLASELNAKVSLNYRREGFVFTFSAAIASLGEQPEENSA
ncbi:PAS domain-containing protein [Paracoccus liaowanqingii]|uniref:histidine kinase n=1 Tax=Paracoccus liaowanqingii TaxID=2560053 RepID=A0A4Z1CJX4_9RHOB|nr:HWE histidine kinase domain-containing protein [Paracoccus liaowanqingii]TGN42984.1 PAS domain-containing protein [Paracoccus liaowanqingii]